MLKKRCSCVVESSWRFCFCKQQTAYEMRISDWSSDVCSSDLVLAAASIFAVAALAPLKTVVPYVIRVNQTTGAVDVQTALTQRPMRYDEAVTKYFLAQYVRTRESWIPAAAEENFRFVTILSQPAEQQRWARFFSNNNAASPQNAWGKNAAVQARGRAHV